MTEGKRNPVVREIVLVLHNIRSAHNVGSIFRTSDAAGVSKIHLTGYTPAPVDRFGRPQKDIAKTALGAERTLSWESHTRIMSLIARLKQEGFHIVGVEQDRRAIDYRNWEAPERLALLFGNEVRGLSSPLRKSVDTLLKIPMYGKKESLNVSVSAGIVLFSLR